MVAKDKLIVALDVDSGVAARALVAALREEVGMFKIGSQLFTSYGPDVVREIVGSGAKVFLDLKFHDIPHQVAGAARAATELGVSMFTVHASGGAEMMKRAIEAVSEVADRKEIARPAVVAVTVLTSIDTTTLSQIGGTSSPGEAALRLATLAETAGVDGVVASPQEAEAIRSATVSPRFIIVTPGIRPANEASQTRSASGGEDQKRVATPEVALAAGANYLVVGRPIISAINPANAARAIVAAMESVDDHKRRGTAP